MFEDPTSRMPPVVKGFIVANVAVFILQLATGGVNSWLTSKGALGYDSLSPLYWYQMFTYMWLHGGIIHLLFNMMGLYFCGRGVVEGVGTRHFLGVYFVAGLMGAWVWLFGTHVLFPSPMSGYAVGASAAVLGLLMVFAIMYPDEEFFIMFIPIPIKAKWLAPGYVVFSIVSILWDRNSNIAHSAHLGGLLGGWLYAKAVGIQRGGLIGLNLKEWVQVNLPQMGATGGRDERQGFRRENKDDFISKEVDPILDKISEHGFQSLTPKERQILEEARKRMK